MFTLYFLIQFIFIVFNSIGQILEFTCASHFRETFLFHVHNLWLTGGFELYHLESNSLQSTYEWKRPYSFLLKMHNVRSIGPMLVEQSIMSWPLCFYYHLICALKFIVSQCATCKYLKLTWNYIPSPQFAYVECSLWYKLRGTYCRSVGTTYYRYTHHPV